MPHPLASPGLPARRSALALVSGLIAEGPGLTDLLATPAIARLPAADRARAQRLALATLRGLGQTDALLAPHLRRRPPPEVLNVLRLAVTELAEGAAPHAVANDWVTILGRHPRTAGAKGLANALIRKLAADLPAAWAALPPAPLPGWIAGPVIAAWGPDVAAALARAHAVPPPLDLTAREDPARLASDIGGTLLPTGSVRIAEGVAVSALPGFVEGRFWVQDAAAALAARALSPSRGEKVLDLCAAPGGKTMQLAAMGAAVTAVDSAAPRLKRLTANLARTGLVADVVTADALAFGQGGWSAILLDAPCSATGTLRRHPELPHRRDGSGLPDLVALQARLIDHAVSLLAPGGRLVFCTCSLLPEEGESQLARVLTRHPHLRADPAALDLPGTGAALRPMPGLLRTRPDQWAEIGGWDGFAIAALRKAG